ncbi:carbohydrate binding domain-containing protein [Streptomyces sp. E11-3]|uniref:carbohydrate binding domain-containing protein n=1 Tax=Streptomyces sp. E11-3 TaxID=3110112 RepID=UPI003981327A
MSVVHVWAGALSDTGVWVRGKVTGSSTRLAVDTDSGFSSPTYFGPDTPTADGMVSLTATGLTANTRYYYALEDDSVLDTAFSGTFRTHPAAVGERASFVFGAAGDAGLTGAGDDSYITSAVSDNPVFDTMRSQAGAEDWLFFSHLGDLHYRNIATATTSLYRDAYDDTLTFNGTLGASARQGRFYRDVATTYAWDDHDFGPNNSDRTDAGNATANAVYRERAPHYTLPSASAIYQSWQVGRVLFIASDVRSARDPNSDPQGPAKTLLGSAQKTWIESQLTADTGAEALVWISPSRWIGGSDTWSSFIHERAEMVAMFGDTGWLDRMILLTADEHALGISSGPNNPHGGFPMYMLASMDSSFTTATDDADPIYNLGRSGGRQRYGTVTVRDDGHTIGLTGTGWINGAVWRAHTKHVDVGNPLLALDYTTDIVPPMEPTDDDQLTVNDVTATREGGGEERVAKASGPLSVQAPPDGVGPYPDQVTVEVADDEDLASQAGWRVHLGTVDEQRFPAISVDLGRSPELIDAVATQDVGDALTIDQTPSWLPPDGIDQIIEGYTETLNALTWDWQANCSPGSPWGSIAQLPPGDEATAQPDQPNRLDTTGSVLTDAASGPALNSNPTFEADLTGWAGSNATVARVASPGAPPFGGSWSARITPNGSSGSGGLNASPATAAGTITPGETYHVSCWAYSAGGWSDLGPAVDWYNAAGGYLSSSFGGTAVAAGVWTYLEAAYVAPASASRASVRARHGGTPSASDVWHADEVTLRLGATKPSELLVHTPQDGVHDRAVWLTAMRVFNGNYDFEESLDEWVGNGATVSRAATPAGAPFPGDWSLRLVPDGVAEFPNAGSDQYAVVPGESYTVSGWLYCEVARALDLNINWFDASHSYLSTGSSSVSVAANTWVFLQGTFTAPGTAAYANMAPTMDSFPPASHVLYGDILTIRPTGPAGALPEQLPYDLKLGGETVRATSVEPLVWDEFGRTDTNTWGTSSSGQAYTEVGGAATDRAVAAGVGTITLASSPSTIRVQQLAADVGDCEIHVTLSVDQVATGESIIPGILMRYTGGTDYYRARLHFSLSGTMFTSVTRGTTQIGTAKSLLFSYAANDIFHLRARLIGHRMLIRAWPDDQAEPVGWHNDETITADTIASGAVGVTCSAFAGNTNTNPVISYDEFQVVTPQRITVERSLNGVAKSQSAGTAVSLARPAVLGL